MRLFLAFIVSAMGIYGFNQIPHNSPPQCCYEVRRLSFIPNLEIYAHSQMMTSVDLHKVDFLKSSSTEAEFIHPVIDSLLRIPPQFQGSYWSLVN